MKKQSISRKSIASILFISFCFFASMLSGCDCGSFKYDIPGSEYKTDAGGSKERVADAAPEKMPEPEMAPERRPEPTPEPQNEVRSEVKPEQGTFTVVKTSNVLTQTYVKGAKNAGALSFAIRSNRDGRVPQLAVRLYGDRKGKAEFSATGDMEAKDITFSASLYRGNELVAGPAVLELVSPEGKFRPDSGDYNRALFDNLGNVLSLKKGQAVQLEVRVNLLANFNGTRYLAADIIPKEDVAVEDDGGNPMKTSSVQLNGVGGNHEPEVIVINNGKLTFTYRTDIAPVCMLPGTKQELITYCYARAEGEAFDIWRLSVVNDLMGKFGDMPQATGVSIERVEIAYPDINSVEHLTSGFFNVSRATYILSGSTPQMHVPKDKTVALRVYITLSSSVQDQPVRFGLDEVGGVFQGGGRLFVLRLQ